jgi:hypothetical protein
MTLLSNPKYFILEESPTKESKKAKKGKKIPRSHDRPKYVHLKPNEIRKRLSIEKPSEQKRSSPIPHERRRHLRRPKKVLIRFIKTVKHVLQHLGLNAFEPRSFVLDPFEQVVLLFGVPNTSSRSCIYTYSLGQCPIIQVTTHGKLIFQSRYLLFGRIDPVFICPKNDHLLF